MAFLSVIISTTPLSLSLSLILLTSSVALLLGFQVSKWLRLALLIIFIGGIIVIFLYISSLSPNTKVQFSWPSLWALAPIAALLFPPLITSTSLSPIFWLFQPSSRGLLLFIVFYLILILFLVVKITDKMKGAIAQLLYEWKKAFNLQKYITSPIVQVIFVISLLWIRERISLSLLTLLALILIILKIVKTQKRALMLLLRLELLTLVAVLLLRLSLGSLTSSPTILFLLFTLAVCEARIGIGLLVNRARKSGREQLLFYPLKLIKLKAFKAFIAPANFSINIIVNFQLKDQKRLSWQISALNLEFKYRFLV